MPKHLGLFDGYTYKDLFLIHERTKVSFEEDLLYVVYEVLECVGVCCSVLQCVEVCSVFERVAGYWSRLK